MLFIFIDSFLSGRMLCTITYICFFCSTKNCMWWSKIKQYIYLGNVKFACGLWLFIKVWNSNNTSFGRFICAIDQMGDKRKYFVSSLSFSEIWSICALQYDFFPFFLVNLNILRKIKITLLNTYTKLMFRNFKIYFKIICFSFSREFKSTNSVIMY